MIRFSFDEIREMLPSSNNRNLAEKVIKEKMAVEGRKRPSKKRPQVPIYFNQFKPSASSEVIQKTQSQPSIGVPNQKAEDKQVSEKMDL
jgi:hypothetical protein